MQDLSGRHDHVAGLQEPYVRAFVSVTAPSTMAGSYGRDKNETFEIDGLRGSDFLHAYCAGVGANEQHVQQHKDDHNGNGQHVEYPNT